MNNKTKTGIFLIAVLAISAMVLIGQNAVSNGFVVAGTKQNTTTTVIATSTTLPAATTTKATTTTTRPNSCVDTDGGNVIGTKGTVYGVAVGRDYNYTDYCANASALKEYVCYNKKYSSMTVNCGSNLNCVNGACVPKTTTTLATTTTTLPNSCMDTDGGVNLLVMGTVYGISGGVGYNRTDSCMGQNYVYEWYCNGTSYRGLNSTCLKNATTQCLNGACV